MVETEIGRSGMDEAELDRLVERSLAATSRNSVAAPVPPRRQSWGWIVAGMTGALLIGTLASPWLEHRVRSVIPADFQPAAEVERVASPAPPAAVPTDMAQRLESMEASMAALAADDREQVGIDASVAEQGEARIAALEAALAREAAAQAALDQRLDGLTQSIAALAGSGQVRMQRVEELLLLNVARKLMQAGRPLGPLLGPLEGRPALAEPESVAALKAWSENPVTMASLATQLNSVALPPASQAVGGNWFDRMTARIGGIFDVREASATPPASAFEQSKTALARGDLPAAIAAMSAQPARVETSVWLADAQRLLAAESALDRLDQLLLAAMLGDFSRQPIPATTDNSAAVQQKSAPLP